MLPPGWEELEELWELKLELDPEEKLSWEEPGPGLNSTAPEEPPWGVLWLPELEAELLKLPLEPPWLLPLMLPPLEPPWLLPLLLLPLE